MYPLSIRSGSAGMQLVGGSYVLEQLAANVSIVVRLSGAH